MANPRAFISFDFDFNSPQKLYFAGQAKNSRTPFEIEDWSSKTTLPQKQWEDLICSKMNCCHFLIVLVGKYTSIATGVAKEIQFARLQNVPMFGVYVDGANTTTPLPAGLPRNRVIGWTWDGIASAINQMMKEGKKRITMRKALIVGIDYYEKIAPLHGCVNDAHGVKAVLERHSDGTKNFDVNIQTGTGSGMSVTRKELKNRVEELFRDKCDIALFYFSGHGYLESTGGYLITSDCCDGDDGLPTNELLQIANSSPATNKIIILDCCHAGIAGNLSPRDDKAILSEGLTILTASSANQYAIEQNGSGVFTTLLIDALNGGASNLIGEITPGSIYAHIDQSLGSWEQRPIFKTNVTAFTPLRRVQPPIELGELKKLTELFPVKGEDFKLDPSFEPKSDNPNEENVSKFRVLQKYNRINLVVPTDAEHMYDAAMESKACRLTILGEHYWNLISKERI